MLLVYTITGGRCLSALACSDLWFAGIRVAGHYPGSTGLSIGAYALIDGVFLLSPESAQQRNPGIGWLLLMEGILSVIAGIIAFTVPGITALFLLCLDSWMGDFHGRAGDCRSDS